MAALWPPEGVSSRWLGPGRGPLGTSSITADHGSERQAQVDARPCLVLGKCESPSPRGWLPTSPFLAGHQQTPRPGSTAWQTPTCLGGRIALGCSWTAAWKTHPICHRGEGLPGGRASVHRGLGLPTADSALPPWGHRGLSGSGPRGAQLSLPSPPEPASASWGGERWQGPPAPPRLPVPKPHLTAASPALCGLRPGPARVKRLGPRGHRP